MLVRVPDSEEPQTELEMGDGMENDGTPRKRSLRLSAARLVGGWANQSVIQTPAANSR